MDHLPEPTPEDLPTHLIQWHDATQGIRLPPPSNTTWNARVADEHRRQHREEVTNHTHDGVHIRMSEEDAQPGDAYIEAMSETLSEAERRDEMENNLLVAGGVLIGLMSMPTVNKVEIVVDEAGNPTNRIRIFPAWMKSPYIVTVERER